MYQYYYDIEQKQNVIINYYKIPLADLEIRDVEETEAILSIDFGTSNTTAGAYLDYGYIQRHDNNDLLNEGNQTGCCKYRYSSLITQRVVRNGLPCCLHWYVWQIAAMQIR